MQPSEAIGRAQTPDGRELVLYLRHGIYTIRVDGLELMSSRAHGSEEEMARLACAVLDDEASPRVLVGGLGMGFTLRAALDCLPAAARVTVVELLEPVVEWCRGPLAQLVGRPLDDPRVELEVVDVADHLRRSRRRYHAILLDVDNGPEALTTARNDRLYSGPGLERLHGRLRRGGVLAVWSAGPDARFSKRLLSAGFGCVRHISVAARGPGHGGPFHHLFLAGTRVGRFPGPEEVAGTRGHLDT